MFSGDGLCFLFLARVSDKSIMGLVWAFRRAAGPILGSCRRGTWVRKRLFKRKVFSVFDAHGMAVALCPCQAFTVLNYTHNRPPPTKIHEELMKLSQTGF